MNREQILDMNERLYFDCNAGFGAYPRKPREERWRRDQLLEDMDLAGIAGALVVHAQTFVSDPMQANLQLMNEIQSYRDRLFPCWTVLPETCGDFPSVPEFMNLMRENKVRAVRIQPDVFAVPVRESLWGELRDALLQENILVLTATSGNASDGENVDKLLSIFRHNNVVLLGARWHTLWRWVLYFMNTYPHLHLEFSYFQTNRGVEYFAERYGPERCLFGTGLPQMAPGTARGFIDWSLLPYEETAKIAGGNLKQLLGDGPDKIPAPGKWSDTLTFTARSGEPLPCLIVDDHCHIVPDHTRHAGGPAITVKGDADGMIEIIRKVGIDKSAIMSWAWSDGNPDRGNQTVEKAIARYPDEFVGVVSIMPEVQTDEEIEATIDYYHRKLKWPGLKPFPRGDFDFNDPVYERWFQYASEHRLYIVYDARTPFDDTIIADLCGKYPGMGIHLDHCGQSWRFAKWAVEMAREFPSVMLQLNYTNTTNGVIEYMAEHAGPDRLLFGTDTPCRDPRPQVSWLVFTRLSEDDKRKIFGLNFKNILDQCHPGA